MQEKHTLNYTSISTILFCSAMAIPQTSPSSCLVLVIFLSFVISCVASRSDEKVYIVYMGGGSKGDVYATAEHTSILEATIGSKRAAEAWLYSYTRSFNGFVAKLTEDEKEKISSLPGVVSVFPNTKKQLHTTRSWDFMGFPLNVTRTKREGDIIIGILDSGIWPESASFNDRGYGPPPSKWKGICQSSPNFTCNRKIIGAKYYQTEGIISQHDLLSPRDTEGHGSHTASTAAGGSVIGANLYGLADGKARGGVPSGRIAVYKICWSYGCPDADILAAFDDAIADGVDIISISVGGFFPTDYFHDSVAIGAFHSMKNGILTSNSVGNSGPEAQSIVNLSPWSLSVAASTVDRKFLAQVQLGNNKTYEGAGLNTFTLKGESYPLVYGGDVPNVAGGFDGFSSRYCQPDSLDPKLVNGTIVLCEGIYDSEATAITVVTAKAGATGTIMQGNGSHDYASSFLLPATYLRSDDGTAVYDYLNKTSKPTATIFKSTQVNETLAPFVVPFSSRGPSAITPEILKPDLTAPGVDILAAWSEGTTATGFPEDPRVVPYNIISGTSMACPHATGAAAYVKSFHPTWSPAAIKSALMTTAAPLSPKTNSDAEFAYGSGQIDPVKAKSPGLVYDLSEADYVRFLCGQGYSNVNLRLITGDDSCCTAANNGTVEDLNYPTFSVSGASGSIVSRVFRRTVTNVGSPTSTYSAILVSPLGLSILVQPTTLAFKLVSEKQTFTVTVTATVGDSVLSGALVWFDGTHRVRSPIVAHAA